MTDHDLKALGPRLRDNDHMPPREAVLALTALTDPEPQQLLTVNEGGGWTILALSRGGLVVVETKSPRRWNWADRAQPEGATLAASWNPVSIVRSIATTEVVSFTGYLDSGLDLSGRWAWTIHLDGRDPIVLSRDPDGREGATTEFVEALMAAVAGR